MSDQPLPLSDIEEEAAQVVIRPASWIEVAGQVMAAGSVMANVRDAFPMMDAAAVYCHDSRPGEPRWVVAGVRTQRRVHWFLGRWERARQAA